MAQTKNEPLRIAEIAHGPHGESSHHDRAGKTQAYGFAGPHARDLGPTSTQSPNGTPPRW